MSDRQIARAVFGAALVFALVWAARGLFVPSVRVRAEGGRPYLLDSFGAGATIGQTFRILNDGLSSAQVRFSSERAGSIAVRCRLLTWSEPTGGWTTLYEWTDAVDLPAGAVWRTFRFPPVVPSDRKVYQFQIQRVATPDRADMPVALVASIDDVLGDGNIVADREQIVDKDLYFRADATADVVFDEFRRRIDPQLPRPLRRLSLQLALLALYACAMSVLAFHLIVRDPERL